MFNKFRDEQFKIYSGARKYFGESPDILIALENYFSDFLFSLIQKNKVEIKTDYDEASYLYPFWQNYPPDERGRQPRGDQFPWIEVGEHSIGVKISRLLGTTEFQVRDCGLPTGPDQRFILSGKKISELTNGFTDSVWLFIDIKSVGPRDDQSHTVMSHNQISGDGMWKKVQAGMSNSILKATGQRTSHDFHCSLPPLYVLSNGMVVPIVLMALKPVYSMLGLEPKSDGGQPLSRITTVTIPNGILLTENPNYLRSYPNLLFPGKDDKDKNPLKVRARVSFDILSQIARWRVRDLHF